MNLEEKLKEFEESCLNLASKESEKLKEEITSELEEQMKTELEEYRARKQWNYDKTIEKLEKDYMKNIFYFQTDCKKEILKARDDLDNDLKQCIVKKLEEYTISKEYKKFLFDSINFVISSIDNNEKFSIGITSKDYSKYKDEIIEEKNVSIYEIDDSYIGGCVLKSDTIFIDNTLFNTLEEKLKQENE